MLGRAAGAALGLGKSLFKGMGPTEIVGRLAPDALFGVMEGVMTPGDLGDKIIAGSGAAIGGATGGLALGKLGGNTPAGFLLDMGGSIGGDMIGRMASDQVLRGKDKISGGEGLTPYEKMGQQQQLDMLQAGRTQVLAEMGLLPSSVQQALVDPTTGMGVN
jgi:hypothetical protein